MDRKNLREGTILQGRYRIGRVLGAGGFGVTYAAEDRSLDQKVVIKEYFPREIAGRLEEEQSQTVRPREKNDRKRFLKGKRDFLLEARRLSALFEVPQIVKVLDWFEENGTAYLVMEFVRGISLDRYLEGLDVPPSFRQAWEMLKPAAEALGKVHRKGIIHRDLNPSNLMLQEDGTIKILDFGAARPYLETEKTMTVLVKRGYAPPEQYLSRGKQGPWTDVYALCGTLYEMVTGVRPEPSVDRVQKDTLYLPSAYGVDMQPEEEQALWRGLELDPEKRIRSMEELKQAFAPTEKKPGTEGPKEKKHFRRAVIGLGAGLALLAGILWVFTERGATGREETVYAGNYGRDTEQYREFTEFVREHALSETVQEASGSTPLLGENHIYTLSGEAVRAWGEPCNQLRFEKKAEDLEARLAASGFSRTEIREENQVTVEKYGIILTEFVQTGVWERASGEKIYLYSDSVNGDLLSVFLVWNPEQEEEILKITLELLQFAAEGREVPWEKMERQLRELPEQRETILDGPCYRVGFARAEETEGIAVVPNAEASDSSLYYWP